MRFVILTFHWTTFPLHSWRSRSFSKITPNRSRSVDSHTIWGLHSSSTLPLRFYNASVRLLPRCSRFGCVVIALLLRPLYDNEDPATLSLRLRRCSYALATTSATELRFRCAFVSLLDKVSHLLVLCSFECQTSKKMDRYAQVAMLQLAIMNHRLFMLDDEVRRRGKRFWVRPWLSADRKLQFGHYDQLLRELRMEDLFIFQLHENGTAHV